MRTEVSAELNCDRSYEDYIEIMEKTRLAYQRGWTSFYNGIPGFAITRRERHYQRPKSPIGFPRCDRKYENRNSAGSTSRSRCRLT